MTSVDFNFAEPIASYNASDDTAMNMSPTDAGSIQKSDFVVLKGRPCKVVEVTHSRPGKHGHAKVHIIGIDIFTGRRYELVLPSGHIIQVPTVTKKDYMIVNIDDEGYVTLLNESTCIIRSDIKLKDDSDLSRRLLDKFKAGQGQIKITVLKALDEEQILTFNVIG